MTAWAVKNKISQVEDLKRFKQDGYHYDDELSDATSWVFTRKQA